MNAMRVRRLSSGAIPQLPFPSFYNPENAEDPNYRPNEALIFDEAQKWRKQFGIMPASTDMIRVFALLIDLQNSFCSKKGTLFVAGRSGNGSVDDARRTVEFIYRYLYLITTIAATLDTHVPWQIFLRSVFDKSDGTPVDAMTMIGGADLENGTYQISPLAVDVIGHGDHAWLLKQFMYYFEQLEMTGRYKLTIWPEHCFLGSWGHNILGIVQEAILFHSYVRGAQPDLQMKGNNPLTENYSVLRPEVMTFFNGHAFAEKNDAFIRTLLDADRLIVPGMQAGSHCGASSIDDLATEILAQKPALARHVYIAEDTTSPVVIPGIVDFTDQQVAALDRFRNAGMNIVRSTDGIEKWPDF